MKLNEILDYRTSQLCMALGIPDCHPVSKGDLSEDQWISFLRDFLPNRYAVAKGFVFDSEDNVSDQIDIIIYDALYSPLIYDAPNGEKYITAESVYAVFEVKQKLDADNLKYAKGKIESVKKLSRTSRKTISSGKEMRARKLTRIIGGLLTNDSNERKDGICKLILEQGVIDIACSAMGATYHKEGKVIKYSNDGESLSYFFFLLLDELYKLGTVGAIDIRAYANKYLQTVSLERGDI